MTEPIGAERVERAPDRRDAVGLARVRYRAQACVLGHAERRRERLGWEPDLGSAETDSDDAAIAVLDRVAHGFGRSFGRERSGDVGSQTHLDPGHLAGLGRAVTEAGEDLVPRGAALHALDGCEDALDVHRAVRGRFLRVRHDDLTEVGFGADHRRRHHPEL